MQAKETTQTNLLQVLDAYNNCIKSNNTVWQEKHETTIIDALLNALPHGSGIDCKWEFNIAENRILCDNSYHCMNENGMYCGYIDFTVCIKAKYRDMFGKIIFTITGKFGKDQDLKDYLYEIIDDRLCEL